MKYDDMYVNSFHAQGFVACLPVKGSAGAQEVRRKWDELECTEGFQVEGYTTTHSRHLDQRFVWNLATDPAILDAVEPLIGPNILLFGSRFFCKYSEDGRHRVSWHQDLDSWALTPPVAVTVWYAVDKSDEQNGCMKVIPGSHHRPLREHDLSADAGNILGRGQYLNLDEREIATAVPIILEPGEISIHDGALIHSSMPNTSQRRRCGLAIRYAPSYVKQQSGLAKSPPSKAILVRGYDSAQNFGMNLPPSF